MSSSILSHTILFLAFLLLLVHLSNATSVHIIQDGQSGPVQEEHALASSRLMLMHGVMYNPPSEQEKFLGQGHNSNDKSTTHTLSVLLRRHEDYEIHSPNQLSTLSNRDLASDLLNIGFTLIWDLMDIIIMSSLAYYQSTEFYHNITRDTSGKWRSRPTVQRLVITYGIFHLTFTSAGPILWQCVRDLTMMLSLLAVGVTFGIFTFVALAAWATIVITLWMIEDNIRPMHVIS